MGRTSFYAGVLLGTSYWLTVLLFILSKTVSSIPTSFAQTLLSIVFILWLSGSLMLSHELYVLIDLWNTHLHVVDETLDKLIQGGEETLAYAFNEIRVRWDAVENVFWPLLILPPILNLAAVIPLHILSKRLYLHSIVEREALSSSTLLSKLPPAEMRFVNNHSIPPLNTIALSIISILLVYPIAYWLHVLRRLLEEHLYYHAILVKAFSTNSVQL